LIEQSGAHETLTVHFFGGEPLLRYDLVKDVVAYCNRRGEAHGKTFKYEMTTNGSLLDDERIEFLRVNEFKVFVSFDGAKQDEQRPLKVINGESSFDTTAPKLEKLLEALPETVCRTIVVGDLDIGQAQADLRDLGFKNMLFTPNSPSLFGNDTDVEKTSADRLFDMQTVEDEADAVWQLIEARDTEGLVAFKRFGFFMPNVEQFLYHKKREFMCSAGRSYAAVSSDGDVFLCHRFVGTSDQKLGDIFGGELARDDFQTSPVDRNPICRSCHAKYICSGGCYHDNAGKTGSLIQPDTERCGVTQRIAELAAAQACLLTEEETAYLEHEGITAHDGKLEKVELASPPEASG